MGRIRRSNEAARAELFATEEGRRGVFLTLVSDVAQAYFELLALDLRLAIARSARDSFDRTHTLLQRRFQQGVVSRLQTSRAEGALASAAADIPDLELQVALKENQINVLLGRDPAAVPRGVALTAQRMPRPSRPGFRRRCSSAGPTSGRPSSAWQRPTPRSAWPRPTSSRAWGSPLSWVASAPSCRPSPAGRAACGRWPAR